MRSYHASLSVIIVLSLLLFPAYVLAASNTIEIQCIDKSGNPVAGVKVEIQNIESQRWRDKKSDPKGIVRFEKLEDGVFRVRSRKEGYVPALYEFVAIKGDKEQSIKLQFEPGADHPLYFEDQGRAAGPQAMEALKASLDDIKAGKLSDAENKLKTVLTLTPSSPDAHYYLGIAYGQDNKWDLAVPELKAALEISDALMQIKQPQGQTSPYAQLHQSVEALLQKVPGLKALAQGSENLKNKNYKEAAAMFQESLKYIPDNADAYYNMALAQAQGKMFDEAQQSIQKAVAMKPTEKAYADLKQQIDGLRDQESAQKAQAIVDQGEALFKNNDYAGALQKYQEAKALLPPKGQAITLTLIGKAEGALNHQDQAVQAFKQSLELDPESARNKQAFGVYYITQKKYDEALDLLCQNQDYFACGQRLAKDPNGGQVAEVAYDRTIQKNPASAEAYYELGMMLYFSKENDRRAKELLTKYVEIGKDQSHVDNAKGSLVILDRRIK